jgi:hypothetical protein
MDGVRLDEQLPTAGRFGRLLPYRLDACVLEIRQPSKFPPLDGCNAGKPMSQHPPRWPPRPGAVWQLGRSWLACVTVH